MSKTIITYLDVEMVVEYTYSPAEKATRDEPGCAHEADIEAVYVEGVDIINLIGERELERIAEITANDHEENEVGYHD